MDESFKSNDSSAGVGDGLPPRPPTSTKSKEKFSRGAPATSPDQQYSPIRSHTPSSSSGHHSGGSKLSVISTPTPSGSPSSPAIGTTTCSVPSNTAVDNTANTSERIGVTAAVGQITPSKPNASESTILRLRREVEALKNAFASSQKRWSEVRN